MEKLKQITGAAFLSLCLSAPASAQFLTFDAQQAVHALQQIQSEVDMVKAARTNLLQIPNGFPAGVLPTQISTVTGMLQSAQACLTQAATSRILPTSCAVKYNTAQAQAQTLGGDLAHLQSLENLARGSTGALQSQQANALATIAIAQRLTAMHQLDLADVQQRAINDKITVDATTKAGTVNPWTP